MTDRQLIDGLQSEGMSESWTMRYVSKLGELRLALAMYAEGHFDHGKRARETLTADLGADWKERLSIPAEAEGRSAEKESA